MRDGLVLLQDGSEKPFPGEVTLSSAGTSWSGFLLERHRFREDGELTDFTLPAACVALGVRGRGQVSLQAGKAKYRFDVVPGTLSISSRGYAVKRLAWTGARDVVFVQLSPAKLQLLRGAAQRGSVLTFPSRHGIRDPCLEGLILLLLGEIESGCPSGNLYGESLSLALISYVSERYCDAASDATLQRGVLAATHLKRIYEYIQANLSRDLTVVEMASVLGLSPNHFTVLFKNTTGRTPHQHVMSERIRAGMQLMESGRLSLAEMAFAVGFSSQSHFTAVFKRTTGVTPKKYQQQVRVKPTYVRPRLGEEPSSA
jgi:AraC family transcriptional regulator